MMIQPAWIGKDAQQRRRRAVMTHAVFVYGTLKRGECRAPTWPVKPTVVREAWVRGTLFHRSDYPAMTDGTDRVLGERWEFAEADMPRVLEILDRVEGTNQVGHDDLYVRVEVETWDLAGQPLGAAHTYHYATDPDADGFTRMQPQDREQLVSWTSS